MNFIIFGLIVISAFLFLYFLSQRKPKKINPIKLVHNQSVQVHNYEIHVHQKNDIEKREVVLKMDKQNQPIQAALDFEPQVNEQIDLKFDDKENQTKLCPKCETVLNFSSFGKSNKNPDGLTKWCLNCLDESNKLKPKVSANKKYCPSCKRTRLKTSFNKNSKREDGLTKWCKDCMNK